MAASDVELLNQRMPDAVTSFISGSVPAVALWVPFNITVRDKVPGAKKLVDASAYYPQAAIMSGWATTAEYHSSQREVLARLIKAWAEGNEYLTGKTDEALEVLQKKNYPQVPLPDFKEQYAAEKAFPAAEWRKLYADGTVTKWLQQVTDFFAATGNIPNPVPASQYFDPSIYLDTIKA
jgi:NitT/TauT family transport system substrate-binding protein